MPSGTRMIACGDGAILGGFEGGPARPVSVTVGSALNLLFDMTQLFSKRIFSHLSLLKSLSGLGIGLAIATDDF
jgi:hypothetical protein